MLTIFKKQHLLTDLFQDHVDIHNHILPGIDDGAPDTETSLELIQGLMDVGFSQFICTPHTMNDYYGNTPETISKALHLLKKETSIPLKGASEYMMDGHFLELLAKDEILPLRDNYILVEMSYLQPPMNLEEILFEITKKDLIPVLAHPERYNYLHNRYESYNRYRSLGCKLQLNALSLSKHYGPDVQKTAHTLLKDGMYSFIATDTHHIRHINLLKTIKVDTKIRIHLEKITEETKSIFSF